MQQFSNSRKQAKPPGLVAAGRIGLVATVVVTWAFQGNVLVDRLAPLALGVWALIWLVTRTVRRMGVKQ